MEYRLDIICKFTQLEITKLFSKKYSKILRFVSNSFFFVQGGGVKTASKGYRFFLSSRDDDDDDDED